MRPKVVILLIIGLILLQAETSLCETRDSEEKVFAVQNRIFHRDHEIDLSLGYIADDSFHHVYPIGVGYIYHLNEHFSWEVGRFSYLYNTDKNLKESLSEDFGVQPERFPKQQYMFHSHLMFKPLYGKSAFLNRKVINHEVYAYAGAGMVHYEWEYSTGGTEGEDAISLSMGIGMKYFISERYCLNVELRDLVNFRESDTENNLYFAVGVGYRFNMAPRKIVEDPTVKKIKTILDAE
jgi:outer membrane beta-barrel protein